MWKLTGMKSTRPVFRLAETYMYTATATEKNHGLREIIMMMSDYNSHRARTIWLFPLSSIPMYIQNNLVGFFLVTFYDQLINLLEYVNKHVNNKMLFLMIHAGYEGCNH